MSDQEPIALIGSACRFPGSSDSPSKLWELLRAPRDLLRQVPPERYDAEAFYHPDSKHHGTTDVRKSYFLDEDPYKFDNGFFNIQAGEAEAIDPQQRMLMETVYDSLCNAGQTIEGLRGSPTAVYVGVMCDDWSGMVGRDVETYPQYGATGNARSIMSNRISYYFDWHGPCMTIDTACSSSLVAVHQAIQALRNGESNVAIAAGANLILSPAMYVAESKLSMLSPEGRSRMWDKDVNGYARGEGIASVVLKPLSAAIQDGDNIECVIRATGVNQDGRTPGLTMPSSTAQAALIKSTYARAGLNIDKPEDRPQFFHAHGTGTPAGDPQEAEAISKAFYSGEASDKLYVGSIKTIIGHTEGTAGLASLIGTSLALQAGSIPPNMHFNTLNPKLRPFYQHLEVPIKCIPWPETTPGQPRRASINSFGFGGTNAHAIIEAYVPANNARAIPSGALYTPLTFSASSESSLRSILSSYMDFIQCNQQKSLHDLAYTLHSRRSTLTYRVAIAATDATDACYQLASILNGDKNSTISTRQLTKPLPKILGVFTGQGAQWARMGVALLEASPFVSQRLSQLDRMLAEIPDEDVPTWTLREMLVADTASSRINEAAISQPLCTAVQIILVDMLELAGIKLHAVVGHSSGEIAAAYAAGYITARDAIKVAYYRGLYAKLAKSPNGSGPGSMAAVGTSYEDAADFCDLDEFQGKIQIAAHNSPSSITLSGDADAIAEAVGIFKYEGKFARQLKVDTAYHSPHVVPCSKPYLAAMQKCGMESCTPSGPQWYSSVRQKKIEQSTRPDPQYWVDNMVSPVLFCPAVAEALADCGPFDLVLEVGPGPALKSPCLDVIESIAVERPPYSGVLARGKNDVQEFSNALGFIWTNLGSGSVTFQKFQRAISETRATGRFLPNLPQYPFEHSREFSAFSRVSGLYKSIQDPPHPILGRRCHDRETSRGTQWRNIIHPREIPWLTGHQIQGQIVFPATGYISMAIEAVNIFCGGSSVSLFEIKDLNILRALAFNDEDSKIETLFDLKVVSQNNEVATAEFSCYSGGPYDHKSALVLNATGTVHITLASPEPDQLPSVEIDHVNLSHVAIDRFYSFLSQLGYKYSWPFHGTTGIQRKADYAIGTIEDQSSSEWDDQLIVHPGMLDTALQTTFAAFCCPGDERMWDLHLPKSIRSVLINPYFTPIGIGKQRTFNYVSTSKLGKMAKTSANVTLYSAEGNHTFMQLEDMELVPFSAPTEQNDAVLFSRFDYKVALPDAAMALDGDSISSDDIAVAIDAERVAFYYFRQLHRLITAEEKANTLPQFSYLLDYAAHCVEKVTSGANSYVPASAQNDTEADIHLLIEKHSQDSSVCLLQSVGENLPKVIRERGNILEHMVKDRMLERVYEEAYGLDHANEWISILIEQLSHRYPRMNLFEVGAGTGGSTKKILSRLGPAFSTYTYTDVSGGFFDKAKDRLEEYANRMIFKTYDMTKSPSSQGFVEGTYDVVIGSNVLHATLDMEEMMTHLRSLIKPGGYVFILETVNNDCMRVGLPMGSLPGWWLGAEHGRRWGPTLTLKQWDTLLRKTGFDGIATATPDLEWLFPGSVFCARALDDRTQILGSPLTHLITLPPPKSPELVIIGGSTPETSSLGDKLTSILSPRYPQIIHAKSIEELNSRGLEDATTILSLTELDEPLLENVTSGKLDALRLVWRQGKDILWVTRGARAEVPYSNMTRGIGRCMQFEYPHINLQMLDVDSINAGTAELLAEYLVRLNVLGQWSKELQPEELLWSLEPEVYIKNEKAIIPRLYRSKGANNRYNALRRNAMEEVNPQSAKLVFEAEDGARSVQIPSPLALNPSLPFTSDSRTLRVTHFLLSTVSVIPGARLMLFVGIDVSTQETFLAGAHRAQSPVTVPTEWCFPLRGADPVASLSAFAAGLTASSTMRFVTKGDIVVLHDPSLEVADALQRMAAEDNTVLQITTSTRDDRPSGWQYIDTRMPRRAVKSLLRHDATKFIDLSVQHIGVDTIGGSLPGSCRAIDVANILGENTEVRPFITVDEVSRALKLPTYRAEGCKTTTGTPVVQLSDMASFAATGARFAVVDCTNSSVHAVIHPIDQGTLFRADKTYFMVGLSGELGQSICKWMVEHGARHIAVTSRRPNVHPDFIRSIESLGASIQVFSMDITSRESLHETYDTIQRTMPPIAGVANGAMVLRDCLFDTMSHENFTATTNPKVIGSQLLDELFHDTPLDFFILFSSLAAVLGSSGQSNYVAANLFMNALAERRRTRGLAASGLDISSVIGLGFVERSESLSEHDFTKKGYRPMSEQDMHVAFAEAILAGKLDNPLTCEVTTGLAPIYVSAQDKDQHLSDIKFCHFLIDKVDTQESSGKTSSVSVRAQLATATTKAEVASIIKETFIARLRRIRSVGPEEPIYEKVTFVEQGFDSLMAVEVRAWLLKELNVDIPVLKILGGSSIADLLEEAIDLLPADLVDLSMLESGSPPPASKAPVVVTRTAPAARIVDLSDSTTSTAPASGPESIVAASSSGTSTPVTPPDELAFEPGLSKASTKEPIQSIGTSNVITSPMSYGQTGFWFLNEYLADKKAFNMAVMIKIKGKIRINDLQKAFKSVTKRHEILRTFFFWAENGDERVPMQGVAASSPTDLVSKHITSEAEALTELQNMHDITWDLSSGNNIQISVLSLSDQVHFVVTGMHHIVLDGYSFSIMFKDLEAAYKNRALMPLPVESQYRSFVDKQQEAYREGKMTEAINHYRTVLPPAADLHPIELLPFAKTATRQPMTTYGQHKSKIRIEASLADKIRKFGRLNKCTSFHVYLGALQALLLRMIPDTQDIFIGIADANRSDKDFMNSVGFFLNLLPLRFQRKSSNASLGSIVQTTRDAVYTALGNSQLPFDVLLRELTIPRSSEHTPLFQVFLDYKQIVQERSTWCGCELNNETWCLPVTGYDIDLEVTENSNGDALVGMRLQDSLYSEESTELFLRSYVSVLEYMANNINGTFGKIPIWSQKDIQSSINSGKGTPLQTEWPSTVIHRIDSMIERQGAKLALKDDNGSTVTYKEMGTRINAIANAISASGGKSGDTIGVFQEPAVDWICSMLAILKIGAVYVPLDLRNSITRLKSIVHASKTSMILTDSTMESKLQFINNDNASSICISRLEDTGPPRVANAATPDAPAIILFTSGSTGEPKGIIITHKNLVANGEANSQVFASKYEDISSLVVLQQSPFSFDFSIDQTLAALTNGGRLHVVADRHRGDPLEISRIMVEENVSYTSSTPSEYEMWVRYGGDDLGRCASWKYAFSGGEAMIPSLPQEFAALKLENLHLFTGYGPAETTCFSTKIELNYKAPKLPDPLPAGHMLSGYTVCIVDKDLQPVPIGVTGEIVIGGPCVASGYLDNADSTKQKFLPDTFFGTSTHVYRSGDRGHLLQDGTLFCSGRLEGDLQVKLRGFRIELVEVEEAIVRCASGAVSQAIVTLRGESDGRYLVAHIVFTPGLSNDDQKSTLQALRYSLPLPSYMQPSIFAVLDDIPRTVHLKADRKAVQALPVSGPADNSGELGALSDSESKLSALWQRVLPVHPGTLSANSDFFLVGGNSILLVRLQALIRDELKVAPKLVTLMGAHALGAMSAAIEKSQTSAAIDWETETQIPAWLSSAPLLTRSSKTEGINVLLTGSQGYLGRHLLVALEQDKRVAHIHCLVRHTSDEQDVKLRSKVKVSTVDLSKPSFGLPKATFDALAEEGDVIVHCAANRNFWDRYETLRPDNLDSVKEFSRLAAVHSLPIHFLSSGAVAAYDDKDTTPPHDGSEGYIASKWAAETYLRRLSDAVNTPVYIHRPISVTSDKLVNTDVTLKAEILKDLTAIIQKLGERPVFKGIQGSVDLVSVDHIAHDIKQAVCSSTAKPATSKTVNHQATLRVVVSDFQEHVDSTEELEDLPTIPLLDWFGKAKKAGFQYLMTSWNIAMGSEDGDVISRR